MRQPRLSETVMSHTGEEGGGGGGEGGEGGEGGVGGGVGGAGEGGDGSPGQLQPEQSQSYVLESVAQSRAKEAQAVSQQGEPLAL